MNNILGEKFTEQTELSQEDWNTLETSLQTIAEQSRSVRDRIDKFTSQEAREALASLTNGTGKEYYQNYVRMLIASHKKSFKTKTAPNELPKRNAYIFYEYVFLEKTAQEIANEHGISDTKVQQILTRARQFTTADTIVWIYEKNKK